MPSNYEKNIPKDEIFVNMQGKVNYELKNGKLSINPDWFSFFRLGVKSQSNDEHWEEKCTLNPKKKTVLSLGGNLTKDAKAANGNSNNSATAFGFTREQKSNIQFVSCYRQHDKRITSLLYQLGTYQEQVENDYKREVLQKFMPFIAQYNETSWERLHPQELIDNLSNIIIQAHCHGAGDLPYIHKAFKEAMTKLGYSQDLQKQALKQIICITNNSQREMTDSLDFSCIHRYSITDGQNLPQYKLEESAEFPVFAQDYPAFADKKGNTAAFVERKPNEIICFFDKVLQETDRETEHNDAFWTPYEDELTTVGKYQARLIKAIGQDWYYNKIALTSLAQYLKQTAKKYNLLPFINKALSLGKKIKSEKKNMLINHHILKAEWNKFNNPNNNFPKTGIYKLLSEEYRR